uniref:Uncharacterized protein n=1 Tax=Heliothis virescens TaxID=7102 RepID=A0A2A4JVC7_HELVI
MAEMPLSSGKRNSRKIRRGGDWRNRSKNTKPKRAKLGPQKPEEQSEEESNSIYEQLEEVRDQVHAEQEVVPVVDTVTVDEEEDMELPSDIVSALGIKNCSAAVWGGTLEARQALVTAVLVQILLKFLEKRHLLSSAQNI